MEQLMLSLASGLIGTIIGAYIAIRLSSRNRTIAAIERLLSLVYPIGFMSWHQPNEGKPALIFQEHYSELWAAYAALRPALPCWKRRRLDTAWQRYMVMEYYDQIPDGQPSKVFQKGTHKTRDEALERSAEFVRYLIKLR